MPAFRYLLRVRYPECDAQGIAFNARYGDWTDLSTTELLRAIDPRWLEPGGIDYRLRTQTTEWLVPARFDDVVEVTPVVTRVGTTSFVVATTFAERVTGQILARVETVYVQVDARTGAKRPVAEAVGAALLAGATGRVTDHAGVGGGRVVRVVRAGDRTTMPWRNGGGTTHELLREGGGPAGFGLRLSIAEVSGDGPFSRFPGVDRVLTLLDGGGFSLRRADGLALTLDRPGVPFALHGEDAWDCALVAGPALDFNVMIDRSSHTASVRRVGSGIVDARFVLALEPGRIGATPLDRWELAELDGPVILEGAGLAVHVAARGA